MSALRVATEELATALHREEAPAFPYVPEGLVTPSIVLQPGDPYMDADIGTFGDVGLTLEAYLLVALDDNETAAEELDGLLDHFLAAMPQQWGLDRVEKPGPVSTAEWLAHGMKLTVSRFITL